MYACAASATKQYAVIMCWMWRGGNVATKKVIVCPSKKAARSHSQKENENENERDGRGMILGLGLGLLLRIGYGRFGING